MADVSVQTSDWQAASALGGDAWVGRGFLFLGSRAFEGPGLSWIPKLFAQTALSPKVVSLLGPEPVSLPGVTLRPASLPRVKLTSITCDKSIYREGRDVVRLLLLDLLAPGSERVLEVDLNGQEFGRYPLTLDGRGAALFELRDLPAGDFKARVRGAGGDDCTFTVAVYRLAPLVASLVQRRMEGNARLWVRLRLEAYGVPLDGPVFVEITDRGSRLARDRFEARGGFVEATLPLTGEGPHALNVQLASDPSRTATVPIVGSRAFEREQTIFSTLGVEVLGALLPGDSSRPVRGIFLEEGARRTSPFSLERVDSKVARLRASTHVQSARFVVVDPTFPQSRPDALDVATAPHPAHDDSAYQRGEKLFQQGKYTEARALFELGISSKPVVHPNYAYYVACCHARQNDRAQAVAALRLAIESGWLDWQHMNSDDDLASLRGYEPFEALRAGGRREVSFEALSPGQEVEIAALGSLSLLAVGAFVDGSPWEGWAALLAPDEVEARIIAPEIPAPGSDVQIDVEVGGGDASVFLLVKDARLLSADTPLNRLAGRIKTCAHQAHQQLGAGPVTRLLSSLLTQPAPTLYPYGPPPPMQYPGPLPAGGIPTSFGGAPPMMGGAPMPPPGMGPPGMPPPQGMAVRSVAPVPRSPAPAPGGARPASPAAFGPPPVPSSPAAPAPPGGRGGEMARAAPRRQEEGSASAALAEEADGAAPRDERPRPGGAITEEPEIVFAGLVEARGGQASVTVRLGPTAADYVVEAFVLSGLHWRMSEARFRAEKVPAVALELPTFVHRNDTALGRVVASCASGRMRVRVLRDGVDVRLLHEGRELTPGEEIAARTAELSFLALPGDHSAVVEDVGTGAADWIGKRVDEPGTFRRLTRTVRLLNAGEATSRASDASVRALRVLPGLEKPFSALVEATADYGHACCEQTAAKMLSACAMYLFAGDDRARRARAESIIVAGVRRERSMWMPRRGFKMYPESSNEPNQYWGSKAALYLWSLAGVRDAAVAPSKALLQALDEGLSMADDATRAHGIAWPPVACASFEDAYRVVRHGVDRAAQERALAFVRQRAAAPVTAHGAVAQRVELAYAAATLLRSGSKQDWPLALALANKVTQAFGASGRLYSTVDSVAAIALMGELRAAGVVGQGSHARVNGHPISIADAVAFEGEIVEVAALQGVVAVEESRVVEESWAGLQMSVPLRVSLERGGRASRRVTAGDDVALRVTLEGGYKAGDLLWVCLPDALSRVMGGGQVKMFSVDFEGKNEVVVPLAATGVTVGRDGGVAPQSFAVCVRNMFEEERAGNPGLLDVTVEGPDGGSGLGRLVRGFKAFFGA